MAFVSPDAKLGDNVIVEPFAYIDANVEIGDGCHIMNGASIYNHVKMGRECNVFPGAVVGAIPQDLKFEGEESWVEIGDRVNIRECATINRGTKASGKGVTRVGSDTLIMSYAHIAHDCQIGSHCIIVSYVGLAGETDVDDWAFAAESPAPTSSPRWAPTPLWPPLPKSPRTCRLTCWPAVNPLFLKGLTALACCAAASPKSR